MFAIHVNIHLLLHTHSVAISVDSDLIMTGTESSISNILTRVIHPRADVFSRANTHTMTVISVCYMVQNTCCDVYTVMGKVLGVWRT